MKSPEERVNKNKSEAINNDLLYFMNSVGLTQKNRPDLSENGSETGRNPADQAESAGKQLFYRKGALTAKGNSFDNLNRSRLSARAFSAASEGGGKRKSGGQIKSEKFSMNYF